MPKTPYQLLLNKRKTSFLKITCSLLPRARYRYRSRTEIAVQCKTSKTLISRALSWAHGSTCCTCLDALVVMVLHYLVSDPAPPLPRPFNTHVTKPTSTHMITPPHTRATKLSKNSLKIDTENKETRKLCFFLNGHFPYT